MSKLVGDQEFNGVVHVKDIGGYDGTNPLPSNSLQAAVNRLSGGPEYNETKRAVVFPITSSAEYDSVKRSVSFETINY